MSPYEPQGRDCSHHKRNKNDQPSPAGYSPPLRTWSNPLHPTAPKRQCAKEGEQLLRILIPPSRHRFLGDHCQPAAGAAPSVRQCQSRRLLFIPSSRGLPKETTRLVVPLPGSSVSRALPTTSLSLQKPSRQKGRGADAAPAAKPATEATRAHPNISGRRQRMQCKEQHIYASLPALNLPTQHP